VITPRKSLSIRSSQPGVARKRWSVFFKERCNLNSAGSSTMRGSGDHQSTGWPSLYQGKIPFE